MENAIYAILSPEGFASILWKDGSRAKEAAETMRITAQDLFDLKVIEKIIPEFGGADDKSQHDIAMFMKCQIREFLEKNSMGRFIHQTTVRTEKGNYIRLNLQK